MAYTTDRYNPFIRKRDDRKDLLKDAEDAFYGGGQAQPAPTPTPTPTPNRVTQFLDATPQRALIAGDITNAAIQNAQPSTNAAGRVRRGGGILNVSPSNPVSGSRYLGPNGTDLGPQYDPTGAVNPLPKGAVGVQGGQNAAAFNRSLNGAQRTPGATPTPQMTHTQMAEDIARRNLTAAGSLLGTPQDTATTSRMPFVSGGYEFPAGSPLPVGFQENNAGGLTPRVGPTTAARYSQNPFVEGGYVFPAGSQLPEGFQESGGGGLTRQVPQQTNQQSESPIQSQIAVGVGADELSQAGIRPGRYADAASAISRSGTGYSYMTASGSKVDIAGPPPDQQRRRDGYGSAYGY